MELEITIKVPFGAGEPSVERTVNGTGASANPVALTQIPPPPLEVVEAWSSGNGDGEAARDSFASGAGLEASHAPPSPAELGIPMPTTRAEEAPPSVEMVERMSARTAPGANVPPGLEDLPPELEQLLWGAPKAGGPAGSPTPPDLPADAAQLVEDVNPEFAPPSPEEVEAISKTKSRSTPKETGGSSK